MLKDLRSASPCCARWIPVGGFGEDSSKYTDWIKAGAHGFGVGGSLLSNARTLGNVAALNVGVAKRVTSAIRLAVRATVFH